MSTKKKKFSFIKTDRILFSYPIAIFNFALNKIANF